MTHVIFDCAVPLRNLQLCIPLDMANTQISASPRTKYILYLHMKELLCTIEALAWIADLPASDVTIAEPYNGAKASYPPLARACPTGRQAAQVCVLSLQP